MNIFELPKATGLVPRVNGHVHLVRLSCFVLIA